MLCHVFWSQVEYKIVCFISDRSVEFIGYFGRDHPGLQKKVMGIFNDLLAEYSHQGEEGVNKNLFANYTKDSLKYNLLRQANNLCKVSWRCLKYSLGTSLLSTLMTYVKTISKWPDPGEQRWDMSQN